MILYCLSDKRFPALMLSVTHSGLTTLGGFLDLRILSVFEALSCIEVKICVALEAVGLRNTILGQDISKNNGKLTKPLPRHSKQFVSSQCR